MKYPFQRRHFFDKLKKAKNFFNMIKTISSQQPGSYIIIKPPKTFLLICGLKQVYLILEVRVNPILTTSPLENKKKFIINFTDMKDK